MMLALAAPPSCCLVLASAALPLYRAPALPLCLALVGPPGEPAAYGWPVMAHRALLLSPLPAGGLSWSPGGLLVNLLPASGLSCPPGPSL